MKAGQPYIELAPSIEHQFFREALNVLMPRLDEPQRRWLAGLIATTIGHGGIKIASELTGLHPDTVSTGKRELANGLADIPENRQRRTGAGRPALTEKDPDIEADLEALLENVTGGDPVSGKTYTRKSLRWLRDELKGMGHVCSHTTVANLLKKRATHCA